jgi:outer membrane receptor protein involved in Fe transport
MRSITSGLAGSYRFTLLAGAAALAVGVPGIAHAQDLPDSDDADELVLEEDVPSAPESNNQIIVTASKREQTLQEVPISVSVTGGETIEAAQIRDVIDLQTVTPSLRVSQLQTSSATTFIIRGFGNGDNNFGVEPSVGVFIDGVFRSRSASALSDLNNVQRIEVLRGPQSTLFGKNASAGVISIVTREPQFDFGGNVEAVYGNYNQVFLRGDVTGPISDTLAFSLDGSYQSRDGFGEIVNLDEEINNRNRWTARGQLLFEPTPDFKVRAIADYARIDEICCQTGNLEIGAVTRDAIGAVGGQFNQDFFSFNNFLNIAPVNQNDNYGASVQMDYTSGALTFTSITAYRELRNFFRSDIDFTTADIATETRDQAVDTFTQEFRITSDFDGPLNFLLGGFYFDETIEQDSSLSVGSDFRSFAAYQVAAGSLPDGFPGLQIPGLTPAQQIGAGEAALQQAEAGLGLPIGSILGGPALTDERFRVDNEAWSIFGTLDFEPIDGLVLTAGFNYTEDRKDYEVEFSALDPLANINLVDAGIAGAIGSSDPAVIAQFAQNNPALFDQIVAGALDPATNPLLGLAALQFQPPFPNVPNAVEPGQTRDDEFTYLFRASYQISPEVNIYGSYATGFKASSINLSRDTRPLLGDFIPGPIPDGLPAVVGGSNILAPSSPIRDAGLPITNLTTGTRFAGPEETTVYEVGMKAQWPGFGFNLALFDQSIEGFQTFAFTGLGFALRNAGEQSVQGFEFDAQINPVDGLVFTFATTYLDPVYDSFEGSIVGDLSGVRPAGIPEWTIVTSATYTHEFDDGSRLINRVDYNHESSTLISNGFVEPFDQPFTREVNLVNASVTLALNSGLEIGAFARNLLDDQFILTIAPGVAQAGTTFGYPNTPRTYGGVVRFRF